MIIGFAVDRTKSLCARVASRPQSRGERGGCRNEEREQERENAIRERSVLYFQGARCLLACLLACLFACLLACLLLASFAGILLHMVVPLEDDDER